MNSKSFLLTGKFAIPKASHLKRQIAVSNEGLLKNAKAIQFNHDIRCHKVNSAKLLESVVTSTTAKELTATDREYVLEGVSLSPAQYDSIRNNF